MMQIGPLRFAEPSWLWLLAVLVPLLLLWIRQCASRRATVRRYASSRTVPLPERLAVVGDLWFWLLVMVAMACTVGALARPTVVGNVVSTGGSDVVILLDASASMRVADAQPDRWGRAIRWVRTFAETLSWREDRVALGLFAFYAAPQLRLSRDPNALFFFLDHLGGAPPFRLDVDTTWDTNLEAGLYWGMRVLEKSEELYGQSGNAKAFVVLTDGQTWSGDVSNSLAEATQKGISTYVIGVGTLGGGMIPEPQWSAGAVPMWARGGPVHSALNRDSLQAIALAGRGRYSELDRKDDRLIALRIVQEIRSRSPQGLREQTVDVYWQFLLAAAGALGLALVFTRDRAQLWWQVGGVLVALAVLVGLTA